MKSKLNIVLLFNVIFLFNLINCHQQPRLFKCVHSNEDENKPIHIKGIELTDKQKEEQKRRMADSDDFKEFNIYLDLENIKYEIKKLHLEAHEEFYINSMQKAVSLLKSLLRVKPLVKDYRFSDHNLRDELNLTEWNHTLFGDNATGTLKDAGIDLVIFGQFADLGDSTLATASARAFQEGNVNAGQPYMGVVKINKNIDYALPNSEIYFQSILVHEFTHILGFSKKFFEDYYHNIKTKEDEDGVMRYYLNSSKVLEVAKSYFNCQTIDGVELENQGGEGTAASHWEARILLGEYMNGYAYTEEQVISEFTLAVLEDSGYYKPNYYTGGLMRYGKNKGCAFLTEKCLDKTTHKTNEKFENEFYDTLNKYKSIESTCSSGRQSRTYKAWWTVENINDVPEYYRYFEREDVTGYAPADFCPVSLKYQAEEDLAYFSGHCSEIGKTVYGSVLQYPANNFDGRSSALLKKTGENFTDHSFCFLSSLAKNTYPDSEFTSTLVRANCYEIFCSSDSLTIKIFDDYIVCPRAGGKIKVEGYYGYLLCPDYNLMCTGTTICNNMFDCIEKKSTKKTDNYNYESRTTQNYEKAQYYSTDNYELSDEGHCPKNCKHCKEDKTCLVCRDDYGRIKEDEKIICKPLDELTKNHFKDPETNLYEKCIDHCISCSDKETCDGCADNYIYFKNEKECQLAEEGNYIEFCYDYKYGENHKFICNKCNPGYGFKEKDRSKCLRLDNELASYFSKDGGISYYPCSNYNENCTRCYYGNEGIVCTLCKDDLILLDKKRGVCTEKKVIDDNSRYFMINDTHAGDCNKVFNSCISCQNDLVCDTCRYGYVFISADDNVNKRSECVPRRKETELRASVDSKSANDKGNKVTDRRKRYKNGNKSGSNYFSIVNILSLQAIYVLLLLIKF